MCLCAPPNCCLLLVAPAGGQYKELMDYLGRDKQMAQAQLMLLSDERARLRGERDTALKQVRVRVREGRATARGTPGWVCPFAHEEGTSASLRR